MGSKPDILVLGSNEGWHAEQLRRAAEKRGLRLFFSLYEQLNVSIESGRWKAQSLPDCDVILARTMPLGSLEQITFRLAILHAWQDDHKAVVNPPRAMEICIDKFATLALAVSLGWSVPRTIVCQNRTDAMHAFDELDGDVVIKPLLGGEGRGILRVTDRQLAWTATTTLERLAGILYVQQFIAPGGRDLRILVWGDELFAVRRENLDDWRTNVSQGAVSRAAEVPKSLGDAVRRLAEKLELRYAAIDLVEDNEGRVYLLEVNAIPGWKGAESALQIDLAGRLLDACNR